MVTLTGLWIRLRLRLSNNPPWIVLVFNLYKRWKVRLRASFWFNVHKKACGGIL